jgi:hypothetical protein
MVCNIRSAKASRSVPCQMDCGSTCSLISYTEYCKIAQDGESETPSCRNLLRLHDGSVMNDTDENLPTTLQPERKQPFVLFSIDVDQKPCVRAINCM